MQCTPKFARCGSLFAMRRLQSLLVIIAMLSAPLTLLASSAGAGMVGCDGMCCLPHHGPHHERRITPVSQDHEQQGKACEHGAASQPENCAMKCGQATPDYGFLSPLAPAKPSGLVSIARALFPTSAAGMTDATNFVPGFQSSPFQPPRA